MASVLLSKRLVNRYLLYSILAKFPIPSSKKECSSCNLRQVIERTLHRVSNGSLQSDLVATVKEGDFVQE